MDALLRLPADIASAASARHFVVAVLRSGGAVPHVDVVVLLTSELVTNAVVHGGPHAPGAEVEVRVSRRAGAVRVEVEDPSHELPRVQDVHRTAEGGRGMALVDHLAEAWGVTPTADGKIVWFEVET